jgi:transposase, mutator family
VRDVLIVCCDGLTGLAEAIEATLPQATVQTCVDPFDPGFHALRRLR